MEIQTGLHTGVKQNNVIDGLLDKRRSSYDAKKSSEILQHTDFTKVRYAQVWEDADVLLKGLDVEWH